MKFIADFHIHSHYSIATSKQLTPEYLDYWGKIKGISVIGTGDFTHPKWIKELKEKVIPAEDGLFQLKNEFIIDEQPVKNPKPVRFILSAEISSIYKKYGKVRKVHNILLAPSFEIVEKIQTELARLKFNITSDGRPIIGFDSKDLLDLILNVSEDVMFIPAHIWTPWFSVLGAKSGFNSIEECFDDLSEYIFAVETGLSSDPPMNWACSILDKYTLISNSDAHSPEKLGRNGNLFNTELNYASVSDALKSPTSGKFLGTIDMFPQEGKYHYAGHRKCNICVDPVEYLKHKEVCPVCGKKFTDGVMNRVIELSDRNNIEEKPNKLPFYSIIPIKEILAEINCVKPTSKKIDKEYNSIINKLGNEFDILLELPIDEISKKTTVLFAEAIRRMRNREVIVNEGYDGEYGVVKTFREDEIKNIGTGESLFSKGEPVHSKIEPRKLLNFNLEEYRELKKNFIEAEPTIFKAEEAVINYKIKSLKKGNKEQEEAINHKDGPALILAGPGTGKTRVLTYRIQKLIKEYNIPASKLLAITFTNKASHEMKDRLEQLIEKDDLGKLLVSTFHYFGLEMLKKYYVQANRAGHFYIVDEEEKKEILLKYLNIEKGEIKQIADFITKTKQNLNPSNEIKDEKLKSVFLKYEDYLKRINGFDLDDLIYQPVLILKNDEIIRNSFCKNFQYILVDEYQDINYAQYELIKILGNQHQNLFVIGDPNQAIYGFRGSDISYINKFETDYPNSKIYFLNKSYRCSDYILQASEDVLNAIDLKNAGLKGLNKGIKIQIVKNVTEKSEAEFIAQTIENLMGGLGFFSIDSNLTSGNEEQEVNGLSEIAVLARTKRILTSLEQAFKNHNIPYQIVGVDPINTNQTVRYLVKILRTIMLSNDYDVGLTINNKYITIEGVQKYKQQNISDSIELLTKEFFEDFINENAELYQLLISTAKNFGNNIEKFLHHISLGSEVEMLGYKTEKVNLMTLHASKGLEFECVFIVGCEENILPYKLFDHLYVDVEEEKRLLYVGMTRAKKYLYLTHAEKRFYLGKELIQKRSPFLNPIELDLIQLEKQKIRPKKKNIDTQLNLFG